MSNTYYNSDDGERNGICGVPRETYYTIDGGYSKEKNNDSLRDILFYKEKYAPNAAALRIVKKRKTQYVEFLSSKNKVIDWRWCRDWAIPLKYDEIYSIEKVEDIIKGGEE